MSYHKLYHMLVPLACVLALVFSIFWPVRAAAEARTVRIGFYDDGDYMSRNAQGEYIGFNFEFLQEISKYTGWKYQIIDGKSWENTLAMLHAGEIDLLAAVYHTEKREQELAFSAHPMCNIYTTLNVRHNDMRFAFEDFTAFSGMKIGIIKNSLDGENFVTYCKTHGIEADIIPYLQTDEVLAALEDGTLDGVAITHLGRSSTFRSVAQFSPQPIYIVTTQEKAALIEQLDAAQNTIRIRNPNYIMRLFGKYFSVSSSQKPVFTREERNFIANAGEISVMYDSTWAPLGYANPKTGVFSGVVADLFASIAQTSGLRFRYLPVIGFPKTEHQDGDTEGQVIACMVSDYLWNSKNSFNATPYYLRSPMVMISSGHAPATNAIAMQRGYLLSERIAADHHGQSILYYNSPQECFEALKNGKVDSMYVNTHLADYLLSSEGYAGFSVTTLANYAEELSIGVSSDADPLLFSILDKSVQYTASEEVDEILLRNTLVSHSLSWQKIVRQHSVEIVGGMVIFFSVLTLLLGGLLVMKSRNNKQIAKLLYLDGLTGLYNLNKFRMDAQKCIHNSTNDLYALAYVDIKQFKTINDTFGFSEGDRILCAFAQVLRDVLISGEACARVSADMFVLLLRHDTWELLTARTADIERRINAWVEEQGRHYRLILVFGVYVTNASETNDIALMLDFASYAKRSAGVTHKSVTVRYDETMREEGLLQRTLADRMQAALKDGEFIAYFQPKIDMPTGQIIGSEALVRWNYPGKGLLAPNSFIPFFEKNGFVVEMDLYIYEQVCKALQAWIQKGWKVLPVSCNFSRLHFKDPDFAQKLIHIADSYQVPHACLELEVTESVFFGNLGQVLGQLIVLREHGFSLAIDDFGTGYSSLGLLQQFTVDVMKLDRSFIQEGMSSDRAQAVVRGVIQMAKALDMKVICEGVEDLDQAQILMAIGCYTAQGFYYARPMPQSDYEQWLQE